MLFVSSIVGIYFALKDRRKKGNEDISNDAENYLMGGRKMQVFPVAMSLTATVISGISLLGEKNYFRVKKNLI
jgi:sodium-coupled monocarboxylate transporter 8/12